MQISSDVVDFKWYFPIGRERNFPTSKRESATLGLFVSTKYKVELSWKAFYTIKPHMHIFAINLCNILYQILRNIGGWATYYSSRMVKYMQRNIFLISICITTNSLSLFLITHASTTRRVRTSSLVQWNFGEGSTTHFKNSKWLIS